MIYFIHIVNFVNLPVIEVRCFFVFVFFASFIVQCEEYNVNTIEFSKSLSWLFVCLFVCLFCGTL